MILMRDEGKPKTLGAIIVSRMGKPKGEDEGSEPESDEEPTSKDALRAAASTLLDAIQSKDIEQFVDAFMHMQALCDDDSDYMTKDEDEAQDSSFMK